MAGNDEDSTLRILIATDNHIGYAEKDPLRGNDALVTFEEILKIAVEKEVDCILLGGDLFHDNKPTRKSVHGTMSLLRRYCFGDKPCAIEFLSDQAVNFGHTTFPVVNYEDPNINVSIPVFSIHGNHDDPAGGGNLCSLDLLATAGLVNYFGKWSDLEQVEISPLLMQKGSTRLALYGLGAMRDERLHHLFLASKVNMMRPREDTDDWFNLFVIHQNHTKHGPTNYIPEQFLNDFLDLVIWGHEHECKIDPAWNDNQKFFVSQPGSSVATSLSEGETVKKHIGLLSIRGKQFKMSKIPLKTVRQFYMEDVILAESGLVLEPDDPKVSKKLSAYLSEKVEQYIDKAEIEHSGDPNQPPHPLVRIRVDYSGGFETVPVQRFGQQFVDRVANPKDILHFVKKRAVQAKHEKTEAGDTQPDLKKTDKTAMLDVKSMDDMVAEYFANQDDKRQLQLLTERGLGLALQEFVDKAETAALQALVDYQLEKTQKHLTDRNTEEDVIDHEVSRYRAERADQMGLAELQADISRRSASTAANSTTTTTAGEFSDDADMDAAPVALPPTRGKGRARARATSAPRGGRGSRGGRGKAAQDTPTIQESFSRGSQRQGGKKPARYVDSDEDISNDSDFGDNLSQSQNTPERGRGAPARRGARKGAVFESDDDEEMPEVGYTRKGKR